MNTNNLVFGLLASDYPGFFLLKNDGLFEQLPGASDCNLAQP